MIKKDLVGKTADIETFFTNNQPILLWVLTQKIIKMKGWNQGIMFFMCNETEELMPAPIDYSHKILRLMADDRKMEGVLQS